MIKLGENNSDALMMMKMMMIMMMTMAMMMLMVMTVFLPDQGIAALLYFFGKCGTIISTRGPKGTKKEKIRITESM